VALKHELNRYTLYDDLLEAIVAFLDTPDLKEIAIVTCDEMWSRASIEDASPRSASKSYEDCSIEYQRREHQPTPPPNALPLRFAFSRANPRF
jgi:hypothetical protein